MIKLSQILLKIGQFIKESRVNYATQAQNVPEQFVVGDILAFAQNCPNGLTCIYTGQATTNVPWNCHYCSGMIFRRTTDQINIVLFDYSIDTVCIYMNTLLGTTWSGWRTV